MALPLIHIKFEAGAVLRGGLSGRSVEYRISLCLYPPWRGSSIQNQVWVWGPGLDPSSPTQVLGFHVISYYLQNG